MELKSVINNLREKLPWQDFLLDINSRGFKKCNLSCVFNKVSKCNDGNVIFIDDCLAGGTLLDASHLHISPKVVFYPKKLQQLQIIINTARKHKIPLTFANGGTGLSAGYANYAIIVVLSHLHTRVEPFSIDLEKKIVIAEQSVLVSDLIKWVQYISNNKLIFPVQPSSAFKLPVRVGGLVGSNAGGVTSGKLGATNDWIKQMIILQPIGEIITITPEDELYSKVLGGNGYYGIALEVTFKLFEKPLDLDFRILYGTDTESTFKGLQKIQNHKIFPLKAEYIMSNNTLPGKFSKLSLRKSLELKKNAQPIKWAILISDKIQILNEFEVLLKESTELNSKILDENEFNDFLQERTSLALFSISDKGSNDIINFPGFEDILTNPSNISDVLNNINQILERNEFKKLIIGYGHLNFRKGKGTLLHIRLPVPIYYFYKNRFKNLRLISKTITEVIYKLKHDYNINPKAEHSPGAFGIWIDKSFREHLNLDIENNKAFNNPHLNIYSEIEKNYKNLNSNFDTELKNKNKSIFELLFYLYLLDS